MTVPQVQNDPIYRLPIPLYISGMTVSIASTTVISISPGQCRDASNIIDMPVGYANLEGTVSPLPYNSPALAQPTNFYPDINPNGYGVSVVDLIPKGLFVSSAVNGANGLDYGTIAASTQYSVYVIGDSRNNNPVVGLLSLTSNAYPLLPSGYDSYRLIGFIETYSDSTFTYAQHKPQNLSGALAYYNVPPISVLSGGAATSFTAIDLTTNSAIPTTTLPNIIVTLLVTFTPFAAGDTAQFRPTGQTTGTYWTITGAVAGVAQTQYIQMIAGVGSSKPEIDYKVTSSSDAVSVSVVEWIGVSNTAYPALV